LKKKCQKDKYTSNPVCGVLNTLPDIPLDQLGQVIGDLLGSVLGRGEATAPSSTTRELYGGTP
jgi:hypothetical protein